MRFRWVSRRAAQYTLEARDIDRAIPRGVHVPRGLPGPVRRRSRRPDARGAADHGWWRARARGGRALVADAAGVRARRAVGRRRALLDRAALGGARAVLARGALRAQPRAGGVAEGRLSPSR